jgi:hypothetical protein
VTAIPTAPTVLMNPFKNVAPSRIAVPTNFVATTANVFPVTFNARESRNVRTALTRIYVVSAAHKSPKWLQLVPCIHLKRLLLSVKAAPFTAQQRWLYACKNHMIYAFILRDAADVAVFLQHRFIGPLRAPASHFNLAFYACFLRPPPHFY